MWHFFVLTTCLVVVGCSSPMERGSSGGAADALAVQEAAFRYWLKKHPADVRAYLAVDGQDSPPALLTRLRRDWPKLQPASMEPKEKGLRIYVKELKWVGPDRAELKAGQWFPTRFAGEGHFGELHLHRADGQWVVDRITNEVMS
jgi:hypothetical protein